MGSILVTWVSSDLWYLLKLWSYQARFANMSKYSELGFFINRSVSMEAVNSEPMCCFFKGGLNLAHTADIFSSLLSSSILLYCLVIKSHKNNDEPTVYFTAKSRKVLMYNAFSSIFSLVDFDLKMQLRPIQSVSKRVFSGWLLMLFSLLISPKITPSDSRIAAGFLRSELCKILLSRLIILISPFIIWNRSHPMLICEASVHRKRGRVLSTTWLANSSPVISNKAFQASWCIFSHLNVPAIAICCSGAAIIFISGTYLLW